MIEHILVIMICTSMGLLALGPALLELYARHVGWKEKKDDSD